MPALTKFMESLTHEQYKLVKMGTIKFTKDQALSIGVSNQSRGNNKAKDSKQQEKKKQDKPKYSDGGANPIKDKEKKKKEKKKCTYCHKGWNIESACMNQSIYIMDKLLEKNNIPLPEGIRKKEEGSSSENKDK